MTPRSLWAKQADKIGSWFGIQGKGTSSLGRARLRFKGARVETRTVLRSSAITKAERTKPTGIPERLRWVSILNSRRNPNTVALIVDAETAEQICRLLYRSWSFDTNLKTPPPSDLPDSIGGTS